MKIRKPLTPTILLCSLSLLAGCMAPSTGGSNKSLPLPPSASEQKDLVVRAHMKRFGVSPSSVRVGPSMQKRVFVGTKDYVFCAQVPFQELGNVYDNSGKIVARKGDERIEKVAVLVRKYNGEWGVGLYKVVDEVKFGTIKTTDICG